jgi:hypothetical protein
MVDKQKKLKERIPNTAHFVDPPKTAGARTSELPPSDFSSRCSSHMKHWSQSCTSHCVHQRNLRGQEMEG